MGTNIYRTADGVQAPGVTTVLGSSLGWKTPGLIHWAWKLGTEGKDYKAERNKAADAGTLAHACATAIILGQPMPAIPAEHAERVSGAVRAFEAWRAESKIDLVASEVALISEAHRYGGSIDAVGVLDGVAQLVDFKSSKDLYPDQVCQVAAYRSLWDENHPDLPISSVHVLRWSPDGAFHHHSLSNAQVDAGWRVFLAALVIYNERKTVLGRAA